jgi:hypothetical protein
LGYCGAGARVTATTRDPRRWSASAAGGKLVVVIA